MNFIASSAYRKAYLGKHAHDLMLKTSEQMAHIYRERGLRIPVASSSVLHFLAENDGASLADIARGLDVQHQLIAQRAQKLLDLKMVRKQPDATDRRRTNYRLTKAGRGQADILIGCMAGTAEIYEDLYGEIGCDLAEKLMEAMQCIERKSLVVRFQEKFPVADAA